MNLFASIGLSAMLLLGISNNPGGFMLRAIITLPAVWSGVIPLARATDFAVNGYVIAFPAPFGMEG